MASDALVMPRMISSRLGELGAVGGHALVLRRELVAVDELAGQERGVPGRHDAHLAHHAAHDELDVLVVDLDALRAVDLLHLVDEVLLGGRRAGVLEQRRPGRASRA